MMQINLVARIAADKNSFLDLVFIAFCLKEKGIDNFEILFIGNIESIPIYQNIVRMAELLNVSDRIDFTKKSIPLDKLPDQIKNGYFFNFSIGNFIGYSGIESINLGLKVIFLNTDKTVSYESGEFVNICKDIPQMVALLTEIAQNPLQIDTQIFSSNQKMKNYFQLNENEASFLLSILR